MNSQQKGIQWLSGQLPALVDSGVLTTETADALRAHYRNVQPARAQNLAVIVCAILGATLIGAGVILLIAHNWDDLGRPARTVISFLPLAAACALSTVAILRKPASTALNEGGGIFHVLAIGAVISLVSQTYHISGDFSDFMLTWSLLALPLIYLLRSTSVTMLYLVGITVWAGSRVDDHPGMFWYWPVLAAALPFHAGLLKENRCSIRANWLSTVIAVCVPFALGFQCNEILDKIWFLLFSSYFTLLYLVEREWFRKEWSSRFEHPFRVFGAGGIMVLSIVLSYGDLWKNNYYSAPQTSNATYFAAFGLCYGLMSATALLLAWSLRNKTDFNVAAALFPFAALAAYLLSQHNQATAINIVMNTYAAALALGTIIRGFRHDRPGTLNAGMVIATALIVARFFDSDLSFVVRGVVFILIGTGFLAMNWILVKRRKEARA